MVAKDFSSKISPVRATLFYWKGWLFLNLIYFFLHQFVLIKLYLYTTKTNFTIIEIINSNKMGNTYSQLNIHCVFAVKGRENLITSNFRDDLYRYMSGVLKNDGSYPLAVNGWKDHVHVFFELPVTLSVSKQMQMLKSASSK
jgi:hypothetical protein